MWILLRAVLHAIVSGPWWHQELRHCMELLDNRFVHEDVLVPLRKGLWSIDVHLSALGYAIPSLCVAASMKMYCMPMPVAQRVLTIGLPSTTRSGAESPQGMYLGLQRAGPSNVCLSLPCRRRAHMPQYMQTKR